MSQKTELPKPVILSHPLMSLQQVVSYWLPVLPATGAVVCAGALVLSHQQ